MPAVCFLIGVCPLFAGSSAADEMEIEHLLAIVAPVYLVVLVFAAFPRKPFDWKTLDETQQQLPVK